MWDAIAPLPDEKDNFTNTCADYEGTKITTLAASVAPKPVAQPPKASTNSLYDSLTSGDSTLGYQFPA